MSALLRRASLRARLLGSVAVGAVLALGGLVLAFNLILASRLDAEANNLARAQAAAQVSALQVRHGQIQLPDAADARNPDSETWVFQGATALERPRTSAENDRGAAMLSVRAPGFSDVGATETRLYAAAVDRTRPSGVVVVGVNLGAYEETRHTALIASVLLAACVGLLVLIAARWLIGRALEPVATMTRQASEWSEHDLDRRFSPGESRDELAQLATTLNGCSNGSAPAFATSSACRPRSLTSCARRWRTSSPRPSSPNATAATMKPSPASSTARRNCGAHSTR